MTACCWNKRPHLARFSLPGLRVQTEPRLAGVCEVGGEGAVPVVTEGTPGALVAVGCESVWVKRVHSLGYLRGLWCDKWTNVLAAATMGFVSGRFEVCVEMFPGVC